MHNIAECLNKFELLDEKYTKNIYFLGMSYTNSKSNDNRQIFLQSHGLIYCLNFDIENVDTGYDSYISSVDMKILNFDNLEDVEEFLSKNKSKVFLISNNADNKILLKNSETMFGCDFFTIYTEDKEIFSDIFSLNFSKIKECSKDEFKVKITDKFSLSDKIKYMSKNSKINTMQEETEHVL